MLWQRIEFRADTRGMEKAARIDVRLGAAENERFERRCKTAPQGLNRAECAGWLLLADRMIPAEHLVKRNARTTIGAGAGD